MTRKEERGVVWMYAFMYTPVFLFYLFALFFLAYLFHALSSMRCEYIYLASELGGGTLFLLCFLSFLVGGRRERMNEESLFLDYDCVYGFE